MISSEKYLKFSNEKILLLKSALLNGEEAINSWENYLSDFQLEKADPVCVKLFPLLYINLRKNKIETPLLERFRRIYNTTWYKNKLLFNKMLLAIEELAFAGIESKPLKGMALTLAFYKDFGLRPMNDFDLLIPENKIMKAVEILLKLGYKPVGDFIFREEYLFANNSVNFIGEDNTELDVHWHILHDCCNNESDELLSQDLIPLNTKNRVIYCLNPENQLINIIVHGIDCYTSSAFQWVADVVFILQNFRNEINWNKLIENARSLNLSLSLYVGFKFINTEICTLIPGWVLRDLSYIDVSENEKNILKAKTKSSGIWGNMPSLWHHCLRHNSNTKFPTLQYHFLVYLQHLWGVRKLWLLPFYFIYYGINRFLKFIK